MKSIRILILLFFALSIFSCKNKKDKEKEKPPVVVDVLLAGIVDFPTNIEVNGTVLSEELVELHPEISGRIVFLNMPDGASVMKGTILARINDADLQAQLEQQKVQLELAVKTEQRLKKLIAINGVNQADYDAALSQVNLYNANIKVLNAQIDKTIIRAPFNGKLGLRVISPGAFVNPQTVIGTLQQSDKVKIDFTVPESYMGMVVVGNRVTVLSSGTDVPFNAIINAIEPQVDVNSKNIKVRARLEKGEISPGTFVKVILNKKDQKIVVPTNAVIPDAQSNQLIVVKEGKAVFTDVETGVRNADVVEILKGINPGDSIVVSGVLFVRPNANVKVRKVKTDIFNSTAQPKQKN